MDIICRKCNNSIGDPLRHCPYCGTEISEADRAAYRQAIHEERVRDAAILRKWRRYTIIALISVFLSVPSLVIMIYLRDKYGWPSWLPWAFFGFFMGLFVFFGGIKRGLSCPFCGYRYSLTVFCPCCGKKIHRF